MLQLFGTGSMEGSSGPVTGRAAQGRRLALLALLALARGRPITRDKLIALLWPESPPERARHQLSDAVYIVRGALGEDVVRSAGDELALNPDAIASDVGTFERLLDEGRPEAAVEQFAGPLLDGFHLSEAAEFERWLDAERARLGQRYSAALAALAEASEGRDQFTAAVGWWRRMAAHDPYSGRVALRLMRALEAAGDRTGALQHARVHAALLREEFDTVPDPEVTAFAERLRLEPPARTAPEPVAIRLARPAPHPDPAPAASRGAPGAGKRPARGYPAAAAALLLGWPVGGRLIAWGGGVVAAGLTLWGLVALVSSPGPARSSIRAENPVASPSLSDRSPSARTIAVLPFVNLSPDPGEEYFSDGLAEELIGTLARIRALRVAARTSSFAFKGQTRDIREIGEALNVATVLEGSVRRDGDRLLVAAQLIDVSDGFHLWSETYERRLTDIFDIQRDLAWQIAGALEAELTPGDRERLARRPTEDSDAHILYLKGRYFLGKRTGASLATASGYFERAIAADPRYAQAHAGLATAYASLGVHGDVSAPLARERMRQAALRATEIDPDLAEAHTALAGYQHLYEWDLAAAEREIRRAIALDPNYPTAHTWYGFLLESKGRFEEAVAEFSVSLELDPLSANAYSLLGFALFLTGDANRALEQVGHAIDLDPMNWMAHIQLGQIREAMGELDAAIRAYQRAVTHSDAAAKPRAALARAWALSGREDEARRMLATLLAEAKATGAHTPVMATAFLALRDVEGAIAWLESAYLQRHPDLQRITADPRFAGLRDDPRFLDLLDRIGLPR